MTAEVAVANRLAVALAADSAVTIGTGDSAKIFQSENKLFELSNTKPVGIMVYNATDFFDIPMEIIIKEFRESKGDQTCKTIPDWADSFCNFLLNFVKPSAQTQSDLLEEIYNIYFESFVDEFNEESRAIFSNLIQDQDIDVAKANKAYSDAFTELAASQAEILMSVPELNPFSAKDTNAIFSNYRSAYDNAFQKYFGQLPLGRREKQAVAKFAKSVIATGHANDLTCGVVIAGFGDDEKFPSIHYIKLFGIFSGKLKKVQLETVDIDRNRIPGAIIPFAQGDAAKSLLYGRSQNYDFYVRDYLTDILTQYAEKIDLLAGTDISNPDNNGPLKDLIGEIQENFISDFGENMNQVFFNDVLDIVINMPKQELPTFAEALVNLTSIKRKVSFGPETVGGPIDVALISKHEGFVWIRRKHYFPSELNERYRWRKFSNPSNNGGDQ